MEHAIRPIQAIIYNLYKTYYILYTMWRTIKLLNTSLKYIQLSIYQNLVLDISQDTGEK